MAFWKCAGALPKNPLVWNLTFPMCSWLFHVEPGFQTQSHHNHGSRGTDKIKVMTSWSSCTPAGKLEKRPKTRSCQPLLVPGRLSFLLFCHGIVLLPEVKSGLPVFPPERARLVDSQPLAYRLVYAHQNQNLSMYTYIYICICVYIYVYVYVYGIPIHIHIHIHIQIYMYIYTYRYIFTYTHTHIHTHTYPYIYTNTYPYISIHIHTYIYIQMNTYEYIWQMIMKYHIYIYMYDLCNNVVYTMQYKCNAKQSSAMQCMYIYIIHYTVYQCIWYIWYYIARIHGKLNDRSRVKSLCIWRWIVLTAWLRLGRGVPDEDQQVLVATRCYSLLLVATPWCLGHLGSSKTCKTAKYRQRVSFKR